MTLMCVNYGRNASLHKCGIPEEAYPTTATIELSCSLGNSIKPSSSTHKANGVDLCRFTKHVSAVTICSDKKRWIQYKTPSHIFVLRAQQNAKHDNIEVCIPYIYIYTQYILFHNYILGTSNVRPIQGAHYLYLVCVKLA